MTEAQPASTRPEQIISREDFLKIMAGTAIFGVVDVMSRPSRADASPVDYWVPGIQSDARALSVFHAGLGAEVRKQTGPLVPIARSIGNVALFDYVGPRFDADRLAEFTADKVVAISKQTQPDDIIFNAISRGGVPASRAIEMLQANRTDEDLSARLHMTAIDGITSWQDLVHYGRVRLSAAYPFGGLSNLIDKPNGIPLSRWHDELASFAFADPLEPGSLNVASLVYWHSMKDTTLVNATRAMDDWFDAVGSSDSVVEMQVPMDHAAIEANPELAARALRTANTWHLSRPHEEPLAA